MVFGLFSKEAKLQRLIKKAGNQELRGRLDSGMPKKEFFTRVIVRTTKMLLFSLCRSLSLPVYMAISYGYLYLLFTALTPVYQGAYSFTSGIVGLVFLGWDWANWWAPWPLGMYQTNC